MLVHAAAQYDSTTGRWNEAEAVTEAAMSYYTNPPTGTPEHGGHRRFKPQSPLSKRIGEVMDLNPGVDLKTATEHLRNTEPELFPEDERPEALNEEAKLRSRQQKLQDAIDAHRKANPHLSFSLAFNQLMKARPELFDLTKVIDDSED